MKKLLFSICILSFACSSVRIKDVQQADGFKISKYKTFNFFEVDAGGDALGPNYSSNLELLKKTITRHLEAKGVAHQTDSPDLLVNIGIQVTEEVQTRETNFANPGDRMAYMGQRNYSWQTQTVEVGKYRQGTVSVHLVDHATNKLVWIGSADSVVPNKEKNVPALIEEGMEKLFAKLN
jgi:hypothetical protein